MSSTSRIVWLMRCSWPAGNGTPGSVTSMRSPASEALSAARLSASRRSSAASRARRARGCPVGPRPALLGGQRGDRAQDLRERALAPEQAHADLLERLLVGSVGDGARAFVVERRKLGVHALQLAHLRVVHRHSLSYGRAPGTVGRRRRSRGRRRGLGLRRARVAADRRRIATGRRLRARSVAYGRRAARELIQGDRTGDPGVQGLYPSRGALSQRDGHAVAHLPQHEIAEAGTFGADADERRTRELDRPQRRAVVRDEAVDPRRAQLARRVGELHLTVERQGEDGAHAAAHHLGRVEVDAPRRGDQRGGRERGRRAHERAHVAGIGHAVGVHGEQVGAPQ